MWRPCANNWPLPPTCCTQGHGSISQMQARARPKNDDQASRMSQSLSSSKSLSLPPCVFSCRIVQIDYYLSAPLKDLDVCFSDFRASPLEKVPVLRVFGATPGGQKTCVHIHGAFPYILVPCLVADPTESYLLQLARSIDHALQVSLGASSRSAIHVFKIVPVKGM